MIYDKNQLTFNIVFVVILLIELSLIIFFFSNYRDLQDNYNSLTETIANIESNQNFNFVQGTHRDIEFSLTTQGLFIDSADNYGVLNGPSMQPVIFDGHTVIEQNYDGSQLAEGDIIRFLRDDGTAVIHRVRADYGDTVFVQGDSLKDGEIIEKDQVTHVVIGVLFT